MGARQSKTGITPCNPEPWNAGTCCWVAKLGLILIPAILIVSISVHPQNQAQIPKKQPDHFGQNRMSFQFCQTEFTLFRVCCAETKVQEPSQGYSLIQPYGHGILGRQPRITGYMGFMGQKNAKRSRLGRKRDMRNHFFAVSLGHLVSTWG